jgi:TorA maturation chaperone TorD
MLCRTQSRSVPETPSTPVDLLRTLAVIAEAPQEQYSDLCRALGLSEIPTAAQYSDLFLFQLYPYASVHLGPEGMMGGEARDRVGGFWRALGFTPPAEPDHLAALLGLYATLADREASLAGAERSLTFESRRALLEEHLAPWVFAFLGRISDLTAGAYAEWAELLDEVLREELRSVREDTGGAGLALHLREAPELPDPRLEGSEAFLAGLLAPVRSGMVLTRADLARVAGELDIGLRAGERRYALEHMLAQDASGTLAALGDEARRQRSGHEKRAEWLGSAASFAARRCSAAASLLEELVHTGAKAGASPVT